MTSLIEMQQALARRLTQSSSTTVPLCESGPLSEFDSAELTRSRETLLRKRISQLAHSLPRTKQTLGDQFQTFSRTYFNTQQFQGQYEPLWDAIYFGRWLIRSSETNRITKNLAAWETLHCEWYVRKFWIGLRKLTIDIHDPSSKTYGTGRIAVWLAWRLGKKGSIHRLL